MRVLLTGGPCSGKTSILHSLEENYPQWIYHNEIARELSKTLDPINNPQEFTRAIYHGRLDQYNQSDTISILDRGLVDCAAYELYYSTKESKQYQEYIESCRTHPYDLVFFMPHWKEIYKQDSERFETEQQASLIAEAIKSVLQNIDANYHVVPTFKTADKEESILMRTEFIAQKIQQYIKCNY
jgi:predicted ATPase